MKKKMLLSAMRPPESERAFESPHGGAGGASRAADGANSGEGSAARANIGSPGVGAANGAAATNGVATVAAANGAHGTAAANGANGAHGAAATTCAAAARTLRLAVVSGGELLSFATDCPGARSCSGNIYVGAVTDVLPGAQCCFVNIGQEKNAVLYAKDMAEQPPCHAGHRGGEAAGIRDGVAAGACGVGTGELHDGGAVGSRGCEVAWPCGVGTAGLRDGVATGLCGGEPEDPAAPSNATLRPAAPSPSAMRPAALRPVETLLRVGQKLVVQVSRDAAGAKGARVTTKISLPGKYAVLLPGSSQASVSGKISDDAERGRLRAYVQSNLPDGFGLIARTEAQGASEDLIAADIAGLLRAWGGICGKAAEAGAPECIHGGGGFLADALIMLGESGVDALLVDDGPAYDALMRLAAPAVSGKIRLYSGQYPLFELYGIGSEIRSLSARKIWLKCGAYIVIDRTEAMTVVDVNSGKHSGQGDPASAILRVNTEAAVETARQLRLRDIGGTIVVDLIRMSGPDQYAPVLAALGEELRKDPRKTSVAGITKLGLLEMTRKQR
ncbi:MAG: Rne/Rng family ribonuclease [Clostridiales bacterium]|nr:Rne/Rng family ribonuclease [Clostridiales bacterium]